MQRIKTMRFLTNLVVLGVLAGRLQAQSVLNGPTLGFTADNRGTSIRPILGIPGASLLGNRLALDVNIRDVAISPSQDYAITVRAEDSQLLLLDLRSGTPIVTTIAGTHRGSNLIAVSPAGKAVAVYNYPSKQLQVIGNLATAPQVVYETDASVVSGRVRQVAVSDDGTHALVRSVEAENAVLWAFDSSGTAWQIAADRPVDAAFLPNSTDVILVDDSSQSAVLIRDVAQTATRLSVVSVEDGIGSFSAVAASEDGRRVFLADEKSGNVAVVDLETRQHALLSCGCEATGFYRLKGNAVFGLSAASSEPIMVLDASSREPRIFIIPPVVSQVGEAQ
jgi:DNA-binding beta-propeller fold protein YncE